MSNRVRWTSGIGVGILLVAGFYLWTVRGPAILLDISNFFCL
jgi:hypothetical protein